eukprot:scaffold15121_cov86-Attheya_sp.AAC.1
MPIRVTFRVKRGPSLPVNERGRKQRTINVPRIQVKSEIVTTVEDVTVKTEEIDDGSIQELEYEEVAENSTAHGSAAIPFVFYNTKKRKYPSWDENFKELVDFKAINGHTNIHRGSGPLGPWVRNQRAQYSLLKEGKQSLLTNERREKLESIGFTFRCRPSPTITLWDQQFQELVDFKKINGHMNFPKGSGPLGYWKINGHTNVVMKSGPLGGWVGTQRRQYRRLKKGKDSPLTNDKREKLENIGFIFRCRPSPTITPWDQRFEEIVDFKKINGHMNVPQGSGPLGKWVHNQRCQYSLLKEGKQSLLTNERREKLENIGFTFKCRPSPTITPWDQRFEELVDFKKINGHTNVVTKSGPLGGWVGTQRRQYRRLKKGKDSPLTNERREKLESIGFTFKCRPSRTYVPSHFGINDSKN